MDRIDKEFREILFEIHRLLALPKEEFNQIFDARYEDKKKDNIPSAQDILLSLFNEQVRKESKTIPSMVYDRKLKTDFAYKENTIIEIKYQYKLKTEKLYYDLPQAVDQVINHLIAWQINTNQILNGIVLYFINTKKEPKEIININLIKNKMNVYKDIYNLALFIITKNPNKNHISILRERGSDR